MVPFHRILCSAASSAVLVVAACDLPTGPPKWETQWEFPADSARVGVAELLPSSVGIAPGGREFELVVPPVGVSRTLGEICGPTCAAFNGRTVPKPPFAYTFDEAISLPANVAAAALSAGSVELKVRHDFPFDPLRPPGATSTGTMTARVLHGSTVLGSTTISGASVAFPGGTVLTRSVPLVPTTVTGPLRVEVSLESPAGSPAQPVVIDTSDRLLLDVAPTGIRATSAEIEVVNQAVAIEPVELELEDIDDFVVQRVQSGAMLLTIENPFQVRGALTLRFDTPSGPITKPVRIEPGTTTVRVEFTGAELRRIVGSDVTLTATGVVSGTGATVHVEPSQVLVLRSRMELTLAPKES